jgi:hypothetical protein
MRSCDKTNCARLTVWVPKRLLSDFLPVRPRLSFAYRATRVLPHNSKVKKVELAWEVLKGTKPLGQPANPPNPDSKEIADYRTNVSHHCPWFWVTMHSAISGGVIFQVIQRSYTSRHKSLVRDQISLAMDDLS